MWPILTLARTHWRALAVLAALLAVFAAGFSVSAWRLQGELQKQRADYEARLASGWQAAHEVYVEKAQAAEAAAQAAERAVTRIRQERDKWQQAFANAKTDDPDCAAWAAGAIRCPLPL